MPETEPATFDYVGKVFLGRICPDFCGIPVTRRQVDDRIGEIAKLLVNSGFTGFKSGRA